MNCEVLEFEKVLLLVPEGNNGKPLDLVLANQKKPFLLLGIPKNIKKYIKNKSKDFIEIKEKTKYKKLTALVQSPIAGNIIDISEDKEDEEKWFKSGVYVMSLEESQIYKKYFPNSTYFNLDKKIEFVLNSFNN